jgi:hypothetical protein
VNPLGQSLGTRLVEQIAPRLFTAAFAFWAGGLLALWTAGYGRELAGRLSVLPVVLQLVWLAAAVALVTGSAIVAELLTLPVLRFLEGYWVISRPLRLLAVRRMKRSDERLQMLSGKQMRGEIKHPQQLAAAELRAHDFPAPDSVMPTRLGNILRAAEDRPRHVYGLDPVVCWPHLWLSLDKETQQELAQSRRDLDGAARLWLWFLLFAAWSWAAWWAPLVALAGCAVTYYGAMLARARGYGALVQAAFDLHRRKIYEGLGWPFPQSPEEEAMCGLSVTNFLWRGTVPPAMRFTP